MVLITTRRRYYTCVAMAKKIHQHPPTSGDCKVCPTACIDSDLPTLHGIPFHVYTFSSSPQPPRRG
eukprot:3528902-Pleurochrysis_carterae.AAC.1